MTDPAPSVGLDEPDTESSFVPADADRTMLERFRLLDVLGVRPDSFAGHEVLGVVDRLPRSLPLTTPPATLAHLIGLAGQAAAASDVRVHIDDNGSARPPTIAVLVPRARQIATLEQAGRVNRPLEVLPDEARIDVLAGQGEGCPCPGPG